MALPLVFFANIIHMQTCFFTSNARKHAKLRKSLIFSTFLLCSFAYHSRADIAIDPLSWGLAVGDTFRLVMVTNGTTNATSGNISTYDTFVNTQGLSGIKYNGLSLSWQAVGTTLSSNAASDSSRYSSQANATNVFNLNGNQVSNTTDKTFFRVAPNTYNHLSGITYTINGSGNLQDLGRQNAYTGFDGEGNPFEFWDETNRSYVYSALGATATYDDGSATITRGAAYGWSNDSRVYWAEADWASTNTEQYRMYAMSELITVVPEPGTFILGSIAAALGTLAGRKRFFSKFRKAARPD